MCREEGYLVLDDNLKAIGVDTTSLETVMKSDKVTVIDDSYHDSDVFSYEYEGTRFFFKTNILRNEYNHYAELIAEELAKDFGLSCADYDLAMVCGHKGVVSKDFRKENATYIEVADIVENIHGDDDFWDCFNLLDIWSDLNTYYKDREDRDKIVTGLMSKIVDKFIFDVLIGQFDSSNMKIMECDGKVTLAPIFDNEYMQYVGRNYAFSFGVDGKIIQFGESQALNAFTRFLDISSREYVNKVIDKMWIIGQENIEKKLEIIERKTGVWKIIEEENEEENKKETKKIFVPTPIPEDIRNHFISRFIDYRLQLITILNRYIDVPIVERKK